MFECFIKQRKLLLLFITQNEHTMTNVYVTELYTRSKSSSLKCLLLEPKNANKCPYMQTETTRSPITKLLNYIFALLVSQIVL
jgi:hypothetical protein